MRSDAKITIVYDNSKLKHPETNGFIILPRETRDWAVNNLSDYGWKFWTYLIGTRPELNTDRYTITLGQLAESWETTLFDVKNGFDECQHKKILVPTGKTNTFYFVDRPE